MAKLSAAPKSKYSEGPRILLPVVEGAPEKVLGDVEEFIPEWKVYAEGERAGIHYGFRNASENHSIDLQLSTERDMPHRLEAKLPRDEAGDWKQLPLLEAALTSLFLRSEQGEKYELVISEYGMIEKLNKLVGTEFADTQEQGFQPRRPSDIGEAAVFQGLDKLDKNEDSYFPGLTHNEGMGLMMVMNADKEFGEILLESIRETELAKVIMNSGNWDIKIKIRRSPRSPLYADDSLKADSRIFGVIWTVELEPAW